MATAEEIALITDASAATEQSVSSNGHSVSGHSLKDLIALENHRASSDSTGAAGRGHRGLRFSKITPHYP